LDYLVLECLAERTLADGYKKMMLGGEGYDSRSLSLSLSLSLPLPPSLSFCYLFILCFELSVASNCISFSVSTVIIILGTVAIPPFYFENV
jgi:hypothetical protein